MKLHDNEVAAGVDTARALILEQRPEWSALPLTAAGSGTDNTMYRLGSELLVRLPRTENTAKDAEKEQTWLPRFAPRLPLSVPEPVHHGRPNTDYPLAWSIYRWIDGDEVGPASIQDWATFAADLAEFVRTLHAVDLMGARRADRLGWYRGGPLGDTAEWIGGCFDQCRTYSELDLDLDRLEQLWRDGLSLPDPTEPHVWLHGDLKPSNLLARGGRLTAVIDFGALSVGLPAAEIDELTWLRARAWSIVVGISGVSYYRTTNPSFVAECLTRLRTVLADSTDV